MLNMTDAVIRPRRFRFGLRTLLAAITLAAVASWIYWDGWARWLVHREQMRFEAAASQLHGGETIQDVFDGLHQLEAPHSRQSLGTVRFEQVDKCAGYIVYEWPNRTYVVFCPQWSERGDNSSDGFSPMSGLEVYRLRTPPREFSPQTASGRNAMFWIESKISAPTLGCVYDFMDWRSQNRRDDLDAKYELVYAEPTTTK